MTYADCVTGELLAPAAEAGLHREERAVGGPLHLPQLKLRGLAQDLASPRQDADRVGHCHVFWLWQFRWSYCIWKLMN